MDSREDAQRGRRFWRCWNKGRGEVGGGYGGRARGAVLFQSTVEKRVHPVNMAVVAEAVSRSFWPQNIETLRRVIALDQRVDVPDSFEEPVARGGAAVLQFVGVASVGDKLGLQALDNAGVAEEGRTVQDAVVSSTAERMPVHNPEEQRFALLLCLLSRPHQVGAPGNL